MEYSETSLTDAAEANDLIKAEKLLKEGADVNEKSPSGYTPLMIASGLGNSQMVELLLTAGADVTILDNR
ncbi:MAG: ankyrin repeat domain-containing protein, partial [Candidatus Eremiobacterota bacterium]